LYHDSSKPIPSWYFSWYWHFAQTPWVDALLWIFVVGDQFQHSNNQNSQALSLQNHLACFLSLKVVPVTLFTYWLYEPRRFRQYRYDVWKFLLKKCFGSKEAAAQEADTAQGDSSARQDVKDSKASNIA